MIGRYAPSPTGQLHQGSLIAAVASFCQARGQGGLWRLRIDDLDTPRVVPGADRQIIETLTAFGLVHDGPALYQSRRRHEHLQHVAELKAKGLAFDCVCSRREAATGPMGLEGPIYPGTCRKGLPTERQSRSVRLVVTDADIALNDGIQGPYTQNLSRDIGDFVIQRADGIVAYQLATVIDDIHQGISEVVRGADLLSSTPRQIWIYRCLRFPEPHYAHIPVLANADGEKLGKSTGAKPLDSDNRNMQLWHCLELLGQRPPANLKAASVKKVLRWAVDNWDIGEVPSQPRITPSNRV